MTDRSNRSAAQARGHNMFARIVPAVAAVALIGSLSACGSSSPAAQPSTSAGALAVAGQYVADLKSADWTAAEHLMTGPGALQFAALVTDPSMAKLMQAESQTMNVGDDTVVMSNGNKTATVTDPANAKSPTTMNYTAATGWLIEIQAGS